MDDWFPYVFIAVAIFLLYWGYTSARDWEDSASLPPCAPGTHGEIIGWVNVGGWRELWTCVPDSLSERPDTGQNETIISGQSA